MTVQDYWSHQILGYALTLLTVAVAVIAAKKAKVKLL